MCRIIILIGTLYIFTHSCQNNKTNYIELEIISEIYNSIPSYLPPPPLPVSPNELDSTSIKKIQASKRDTLKFKNAIYYKFFNDSIIRFIDNAIMKDINFKSLSEFKKLDKEIINTKVLNKILLKNVKFIKKRMVSLQEKKRYRITSVLSFSKIYFNKSSTQAIVGVQSFSEGLDSSYSIYFLELIENKWKIVEKDVISFS